jgi:hypothetical protein
LPPVANARARPRHLTHDFERMNLFKGTDYVGLEDVYEKEFAT